MLKFIKLAIHFLVDYDSTEYENILFFWVYRFVFSVLKKVADPYPLKEGRTITPHIFFFLNYLIRWNFWLYFATLLKTTAPVKLPISQLSPWICSLKSLLRQLKLNSKKLSEGKQLPSLNYKVSNFSLYFCIHKHIHLSMITYFLVKKTVLDNRDN